MKKTIDNFENLYVASVIWDYPVELEAYEQYETFGKVQHNIIVSQKRVLVYSKKDENGEIKYYNYNTGKELYICKHTHNFYTTSHYQISIKSYLSKLTRRNLLFPKMSYDHEVVGFLVPFDKFFKGKVGINIDSLSIDKKANLLNIYNLFAGKPFYLSDSEEKSHKIIETKLGYKFEEKFKEKSDEIQKIKSKK